MAALARAAATWREPHVYREASNEVPAVRIERPVDCQRPFCAADGRCTDGPRRHRRVPALGTPDYLRVLGAILKKFNHLHSTKNKGASFKTMLDRQRLYASFFRELRHHTPYHNLDPRQLANRHIEAMVKRWVARGLATATIHNYLSFLRSYGSWIGKPGMVREPQYYVGTESPHAHRSQVATFDHSWAAKSVDIEAKIAEVSAFDRWVGLQLELCARFGMRPKEARHFRPHGAVIPRAAAIARDADAFPEHDTFLRISHGTKGGRPRDVPITSDAQRDLLARVTEASPLACMSGGRAAPARRTPRAFTTSSASSGSRRINLGSSRMGCAISMSTTRFKTTPAARRRRVAQRRVPPMTTKRASARHAGSATTGLA